MGAISAYEKEITISHSYTVFCMARTDPDGQFYRQTTSVNISIYFTDEQITQQGGTEESK